MTPSEYYRWLKREWPMTGLILSIFLFVFLFVFVRPVDFVVFVLLLQTPLYMLHQTEEYIFPGGFGAYFNRQIFKLESEEGPVDENFIFFVNVILIWIVLPTFGLLSTIDTQFGLWIPYFSFFAGVAHLLLALRAGKLYSPGLVVSVFLNIPVGLWSIHYLIDRGVLHHFFLNVHFFIGLGLNALLPIMGALLLRNYRSHARRGPSTKNAG